MLNAAALTRPGQCPFAGDVVWSKSSHLKVCHLLQAIADLQNESEAAKEAHRCRICLTNEVDAVMTQCGHALCWTCASGCHDRCPFCRTASFSIRMYR